MTMNITSKQMEITPAIRQHVADRLAKLEKWQTHLINPHIILSKEPQGFIADATINTPNGHLVASAKHEDMYTAINELINKLERQLNKVHAQRRSPSCHRIGERCQLRRSRRRVVPYIECIANAPSGAFFVDRIKTVRVLYLRTQRKQL